jgi:membrane carboxypeptidase/penicillin-binding protein PbpC
MLQGALPSFPNGITAASMVYDVPIEFDNGGQPYIPVNIDRLYHGPMSVRDALANSYNVPPVQLASVIGLGPIIRTAHRLGINSLNQVDTYGLALALGSGEVSLLDMTYAYNVFNTGGYMVGMPVHKNQATPGFRTLNPVAVLRIEDERGNVLWEYGAETGTFKRRLILEPALAYIVTDILADNQARIPAFGDDSPMELSIPAAAKTGTSNDNRDSWTIGYTPHLVTGVWVGNNNYHPMNDVTGTTGAAPIWHAIMEYAHTRDALPVREWQRPPTVIERVVCQISGLLPTRDCPQRRELFYVDPALRIDTQPAGADLYWDSYSVNVCTNRLATASSSPECVQDVVLFDYPAETRAWARDTGQNMPPTEYDVVGAASPTSPVRILAPAFMDQVSGAVEIRGSVQDENFAYFRLDYGAGTLPDVWRQIGTQSSEQGSDLVMGAWDTTGLSEGAVYTLRLQMVRTDNSLEATYVSVTVDNEPPQVTLTSPTPGAIFSAEGDVVIDLEAEPDDNVHVAYVEFYRGEEWLATSEEWPYTARWEITETGAQTFWAVAYDAAGNRVESERITVEVGP